VGNLGPHLSSGYVSAMAARKMAKSQRPKGKKGIKLPPKKVKTASRPRTMLDQHALAYAKLLADPCGADLVHPPHMYGSSGYLTRLKAIVTAGNNGGAVDSYTAFVPTGDPNGVSSLSQFQFGYSTTAGGALGTITGASGLNFLAQPVVGQFRPVAGCAKVHYTGSELNRSGTVTLGVLPQLAIAAGEVATAASNYVNNNMRTVRLGSEPHEVRWLPLSPADERWYSADETLVPGTSDWGTSLVVYVQNAPAGSVTIEVDFVYEWVPGATQGITQTVIAPKSANTTKDVLRFVSNAAGGLAEFATSPSGKRVLGSVARGVYAVMNTVGPALAAAI